jgi:putative intracellular protease/amidase
MSVKKTVLMIVTSHSTFENGHPTGIWFEEFAKPYRIFKEKGYQITVASTQGGSAPVDPRSEPTGDNYAEEHELLKHTAQINKLTLNQYDAIFIPGGHGTMYDLPESKVVGDTIASFLESGRVVAAVCHGPAALVGARFADGKPVISGRRVTGFTNKEEVAVELHKSVPFLLESELRELGAEFVGTDNWNDHVVVDDNLITGQNPQSSASAAYAVTEQLGV